MESAQRAIVGSGQRSAVSNQPPGKQLAISTWHLALGFLKC